MGGAFGRGRPHWLGEVHLSCGLVSPVSFGGVRFVGHVIVIECHHRSMLDSPNMFVACVWCTSFDDLIESILGGLW